MKIVILIAFQCSANDRRVNNVVLAGLWNLESFVFLRHGHAVSIFLVISNVDLGTIDGTGRLTSLSGLSSPAPHRGSVLVLRLHASSVVVC